MTTEFVRNMEEAATLLAQHAEEVENSGEDLQRANDASELATWLVDHAHDCDALRARLAEAERLLRTVVSEAMSPDFGDANSISDATLIACTAFNGEASPRHICTESGGGHHYSECSACSDGVPLPGDEKPADDGLPKWYRPDERCSQCGGARDIIELTGCPESRGGCGRKARAANQPPVARLPCLCPPGVCDRVRFNVGWPGRKCQRATDTTSEGAKQ